MNTIEYDILLKLIDISQFCFTWVIFKQLIHGHSKSTALFVLLGVNVKISRQSKNESNDFLREDFSGIRYVQRKS